jgi:hypothetical protein
MLLDLIKKREDIKRKRRGRKAELRPDAPAEKYSQAHCPQRSLRPILTVDVALKISSAPKALVLHLLTAFPIRALAVCPVDNHPLIKNRASQLIAGVIASRKTGDQQQ